MTRNLSFFDENVTSNFPNMKELKLFVFVTKPARFMGSQTAAWEILKIPFLKPLCKCGDLCFHLPHRSPCFSGHKHLFKKPNKNHRFFLGGGEGGRDQTTLDTRLAEMFLWDAFRLQGA